MVDKTDKAISKHSVSGIGYEPTYSGVTSLFRREYSKNCTTCRLSNLGSYL